MRAPLSALTLLGCLGLSTPPAAAAEGLAAPAAAEIWPRWQVRLTAHDAVLLRSARLVDGYLPWRGPLPAAAGASGGLRATGGLVPSPSASAPGLRLGPPVAGDPLPYLGLGWTQIGAGQRWNLTADLGLVAENPGGVLPLGRALLGNMGGADAAWRDLRLSPLLQLNLNVAF